MRIGYANLFKRVKQIELIEHVDWRYHTSQLLVIFLNNANVI